MKRLGIVLVVAFVFALPGCGKKNKAEMQKAAVEQGRAALYAETDKVLKGWLDEMAKTLPPDVKKYPKVRSPLVRWRLESLKYDWRQPLGTVLAKAKGSAFEAEFKTIPEFLDVMEKFWKKEADFKDYMAAWQKLKDSSKDPLANLLADFDHTFVHVEAFYGAQDMEGDDRAIYFFRHWQVAFNFVRENQESVSEYLARICKTKMPDYCIKVPFESLHFAMERPYLTEVKRIVDEYLKAYPDSPLNRIFPPFVEEVTARLANVPDFAEDPNLPTARGKSNFVGDLVMKVRRKGLEYEDRNYLDFSKGWILPASSWSVFGKAMDKIQPGLEKERGPENMEVIRTDLEMDAVMDIPAAIVEVMKKHPARILTFGARRRVHGVSRGTVVGRFIFREVKVTPRKLELDGVGKVACRPLGQTDESQDLPSKVSNVVWLDGQGLQAGRLDGGKVTGLAKVDDDAAAKALLAGPSLLLVANDVTYGRFVPFVETLFVGCRDDTCDGADELKPRLEAQVCTKP